MNLPQLKTWRTGYVPAGLAGSQNIIVCPRKNEPAAAENGDLHKITFCESIAQNDPPGENISLY
jgi:hypothetical protein